MLLLKDFGFSEILSKEHADVISSKNGVLYKSAAKYHLF